MRHTGPFHLHTDWGPPCLHAAHNRAGSRERVLRYTDTRACLLCVESLRKPRLAVDVHRIESRWRPKFLDFWSSVEIADPASCWIWRGYRHKNGRAEFSFRRLEDPSNRSHQSPPRVAFWFSWGDIGSLPIRHTCGNPACCNPLHLRAVRVTHRPWASRLDALDLAFNSRELRAQLVAERRSATNPDPRLPTSSRPARVSRQQLLNALANEERVGSVFSGSTDWQP